MWIWTYRPERDLLFPVKSGVNNKLQSKIEIRNLTDRQLSFKVDIIIIIIIIIVVVVLVAIIIMHVCCFK